MQRAIVGHRISACFSRTPSVTKRKRDIAAGVAAARLETHASPSGTGHEMNFCGQCLLPHQHRFIRRPIGASMRRGKCDPAALPVIACGATFTIDAGANHDIYASCRRKAPRTGQCGEQPRNAAAGARRVDRGPRTGRMQPSWRRGRGPRADFDGACDTGIAPTERRAQGSRRPSEA